MCKLTDIRTEEDILRNLHKKSIADAWVDIAALTAIEMKNRGRDPFELPFLRRVFRENHMCLVNQSTGERAIP